MADLQMRSSFDDFWLQGKQSRADSVDTQWRAAAHGYAAQVLHPERYPVTFQMCHCTMIPWVFSHISTETCNALPACLPAHALMPCQMLTCLISHLFACCLSALSDLH